MKEDGPPSHSIDERERWSSDDTRPSRTQPPALRVQERIGPYQIVREVGRGGMGAVYEAVQEQPIHRRVALKLIRPDLASDEFTARFRLERQALALLQHPCITHVHDAGATDDGVPYCVMEFVDGIPLTEFCRRERLTLVERIELFQRICDGVGHAHQRGLVHRDLKPSNILVSRVDGTPAPKIIDFGLAKSLSNADPTRGLVTSPGYLMGTPAYMSPEQATFPGTDVDTRTDVYSLGVIVYEMLTGELPFGLELLEKKGPEAYLHCIRELDPPPMSIRLTEIPAIAGRIATESRTSALSLIRDLRGDLDWIVQKALEKDRTHRFASPAELSSDFTRHQRSEPVLAGPPDRLYRVQKFVRRHRAAVVSSALITVALIAGVVGSTIGLIRATRAERQARTEANTASEAVRFLVDLFRTSDPDEARGKTISVREVLDRGASRIDHELASQPLVKARLLGAMGGVYRNLGIYEPSIRLLDSAIAIRGRTSASSDLDLARDLSEKALASVMAGRPLDGLESSRRSYAIRHARLGERDVETARSMYLVGLSLTASERFEEGRPFLERALSVFREKLPTTDPILGWCLNDLGVGYLHTGRPASARPLLEEALRMKETNLGTMHRDVAVTMSNLAAACWGVSENARGDSLNQQALAIDRSILGPSHPNVARDLSGVAGTFRRRGQPGQARDTLNAALQILERTLDPGDVDIGSTLTSLALLDVALGRTREAEREFQRALRILTAYPRSDAVPACLDGYASLLDREGRHAEADALRSRRRVIPSSPTSP